MRAIIIALSLLFGPLACAGEKPAMPPTGAAAPGFELNDIEGVTLNLESLRGKYVVLEWFNPGCPFVVHAHEKGPLKDLPKRWTDKDVTWLAINSGAPGKQGAGAEQNRAAKAEWSMAYPILLDESGTVGRAYGAITTPQMVVIDPQGQLIYNGGLDNAPFGRGAAADRQLYIDDVLTAVTAGKPSPHTKTKPYGCSVKYGS